MGNMGSRGYGFGGEYGGNHAVVLQKASNLHCLFSLGKNHHFR